MSKNDYKVLYDKAEKDKIKGIVNKVKEQYEKYEKGSIDFKDLRDVIVNDLQLASSENFDKLSSTAGRDKKTFSGLLQSLDILKKKPMARAFTVQQIKDSTAKRFPRYVRNKKYKVPEHEVDDVQDNVTKFLKRQIDSNAFEGFLREKNINPNIEEIRKYVRSHEAGLEVKFQDFLYSVKRFNSNGIDPSTITCNFEFKPPKYFSTTEEDIERATVVTGSQPMKMQKKKPNSKNPNYVSQKELFDWEENEQKEILNKAEYKQPNPTTKQKFVFESTVFKKDTVDNDKKNLL